MRFGLLPDPWVAGGAADLDGRLGRVRASSASPVSPYDRLRSTQHIAAWPTPRPPVPSSKASIAARSWARPSATWPDCRFTSPAVLNA